MSHLPQQYEAGINVNIIEIKIEVEGPDQILPSLNIKKIVNVAATSQSNEKLESWAILNLVITIKRLR